jgi:putative ABC transport system permease protein
MKFLNIIKMSFKNIKSNKLRSGLTMLGLIIGIASVIVLVGIGTGATTSVTDSVQSLGTDVLTLNINSTDASLEYEQVDDLLDIQNINQVAPYKNISATASRGTTTSSRASIIATNDNYLDITNVDLAKGRRISLIDIENETKICILGNDIAETLFDLVDPIGQSIKLDGDNYTVVGVLTEQGSSMGNDIDSMIVIPLTAAKYFGEDTTINNIYVKVDDEDKIDMTETLIGNYLRSTLLISSDYYSVTSQSSMLDAMDSISDTLTLLLGGIASISLIVGGIGVMNVMLVSVTERTKEIGIRKSLGAKRFDILMQFLVESLVLSLLGGLLGILLGISVGNLAEKFGYSFTASTSIILISFCSSAFIGLIFGIFPAYRAACLKPIDALRTD